MTYDPTHHPNYWRREETRRLNRRAAMTVRLQ